jgi:V/A-type H+-transporting ATPase subunit I
MFRPERMLSTTIICLKKDIDTTLEVLNEFGDFHTEDAAEKTLVEYDHTIQKVEESISDINVLIRQLIVHKAGLTDFFQEFEPSQIQQITAENWQVLSETTSQEISLLKKEMETINTSLKELQEKRDGLQRLKNVLAIMQTMGTDLKAMEELKLIHIAIAGVPKKNLNSLNKSLTGFPIILSRGYLTKETEFICLALPAKYVQDANKILKNHHAEIFTIPKDLPHDPEEALQEVSKRLSENDRNEKEAKSALRKFAETNKSKLFPLRETSQNILTLLQTKRKTLQSGRLATIKGFVPEKKYHALVEKVETFLNENALVLQNEIVASDDPPTKFRNNRLIKPFEEITKLYGLPHYDELDPTPFIAVSFPLLFGLMFGDMGHGLVLLVGGLALWFLIKKKSAMKNMCWIMATCGIGAMIAGALFGEFFGKQIFSPLWFSPFNNVLTFLIFSLFVGVVQIMSGLVIELFDYLLTHNVADALLTSLPKISFYLGAVYLVASYQLNFGAWLNGPILFALIPFLALIFGKTILFRVTNLSRNSVKISKEKVSLGERFFESSDLVARLLSNTMSYTRILALLMAHWALILVTYIVAGLVGSGSFFSTILGGIIIVGGNIFVIALEGLIVFIHVLRLHFYEWFSKFYRGTGTQFTPFKQYFVYSKVVIKERTTKPQLEKSKLF